MKPQNHSVRTEVRVNGGRSLEPRVYSKHTGSEFCTAKNLFSCDARVRTASLIFVAFISNTFTAHLIYHGNQESFQANGTALRCCLSSHKTPIGTPVIALSFLVL